MKGEPELGRWEWEDEEEQEELNSMQRRELGSSAALKLIGMAIKLDACGQGDD